jgi:hypothetical protein
MTMPNNFEQYAYSGEVTRVSDGVGFGKRPISQVQLEFARDAVRFLAARRGMSPTDANQATVIDSPIYSDEATGLISGLKMQLACNGHSVEEEFGPGLFESYFESQTTDLVKSKQLLPADKIRYDVYAEGRLRPATSASAVVVRKPLPLVDGEIDDWLDGAKLVGPHRETDYPVFVEESALERAFEIVWKRNEERGVWLVGKLCRQVEPVHEIFGVVHTVFEAEGVTHSRFNLSLSPETFLHVDRQLALRRKRFGPSGEMTLGFYHTHPFLPAVLDGKESCPECPLRPECNLTSSFFSKQDAHAFHIPYFGGAAYAVELVLGLTPREEFDLKMFCLDGGQFRERGFYRVPSRFADVAPAVLASSQARESSESESERI